MRRVHSTQIGFVCPIASSDTGESVGIVKQLAILTTISQNQDSSIIKNFILKMETVSLIKNVDFLTIQKLYICRIFINGIPYAITTDPHIFIRRFREYRRGFNWDEKKNILKVTH